MDLPKPSRLRLSAFGDKLTSHAMKLSRIAFVALCLVAAQSFGGEPVMTRGDHWSFQPVKRPAAPAAVISPAARNWARNPIDRFILARLEKEQLSPSPEADRATLIRRLKFDLLGLPPTPEEVDAFVRDRDSAAYQ